MENIINLSRNENHYGPSPNCIKVLKKLKLDELSKYTMESQNPLFDYLSDKLKLNKKNILVGYGIEDILIHIIEIYVQPRDKILLPLHTWPYFFSLLKKRKATIKTFRLNEEDNSFEYDIEKIIKSIKKFNPKLIIIPSPNNPTGNIIKLKTLKKILNGYKGIVLLDEAYFGFNKIYNSLSLIKSYNNLIILRSFSKYYALAGVRIGYAVLSCKLKKNLNWIDKYMGISLPIQKVTIAALKDDAYYKKIAKKIIKDRDSLIKHINNSICFKAYKSLSNFVLVKIRSNSIKIDLVNTFKENKIVVNDYKQEPLSNYIKFSIGLPKHLVKIKDIFSKIDESHFNSIPRGRQY